MRSTMTILAATFAWASCGGGQVEPAGPPLRPDEQETVVAPTTDERTDCDRVTIGDDKPAFKYGQRSLAEAQNLANKGFSGLRAAEQRGVSRAQRERMITQAVDDFITALLADPYNVHATYNLAAAMARIDRPQCALNMLSRLIALRRLVSQTEAVDAKLDRLLGRGKYNGRLDPDFSKMRDDERFRKLIRKFEPAVNK